MCFTISNFSLFFVAERVTVTVTISGCAALPYGLRLRGVRGLGVQDVARFASFCKGDRIHSINGIPVRTDDEIREILQKVPQSAETVTFSVERGRHERIMLFHYKNTESISANLMTMLLIMLFHYHKTKTISSNIPTKCYV